MTDYKACICEGSAERAILDLLLDSHKLFFEREELLDEELLICRKGQEFEARYLRKGFEGKITVYRILDSRAEKFKLSKAYENKVEVINVITAPEIEMLVICKEGKYKAYENAHRKNPKLKPSSYCKGTLGYKNIKDYDFVKTYFSDVQTLIDVLFEYRRITKIHKDEKTLSDLLR